MTTAVRGNSPSVIRDDGAVEWWDENGSLHSHDDQPALITAAGDLYWYDHGVIHRPGNRPAIICPAPSGRRFLLPTEHFRALRSSDPADLTERYLSTAASRINEWKAVNPTLAAENLRWPGTRSYYQRGGLHRSNGPAYEHGGNAGAALAHFGYRWCLNGENADQNTARRLKAAWTAKRLTDQQVFELVGRSEWVASVLLTNRRIALSSRAWGFCTLLSPTLGE